MKKALPIVLVLLVLGAAVEARAQLNAYLGAFGGFSSQKPTFSGVTFNRDTTFVYGLRAGVEILNLGLELNYFKAAHNIDVTEGPFGDWNGQVNDYTFIGASAKLIFPIVIVHPYLSVGYGFYTVDIHNIDKDSEGGWNFGGGVEVKLGGTLGIIAEGKWHHVNVSIQDLKIGLGDFTLTGGLNIHL